MGVVRPLIMIMRFRKIAQEVNRNMSVMDIMENRSAFSFEVFPPKTDVGMEKLCGKGGVLEQLYTLNPDCSQLTECAKQAT